MRRLVAGLFVSAVMIGGLSTPQRAAIAEPASLVTSTVDDRQMVILKGEHPAALFGAGDKGELEASHNLPHIMMALKRPAASQAAFDRLVAEQQDPKSPHYQKWLKPEELRQFGPAKADVEAVTKWLNSRGFIVNHVAASGMSIDFGGTAAQVAKAFQTSLHHIEVVGERHIANISDPAIPAALEPVVRGMTLSNFFPKSNAQPAKPLNTLPTPFGKFFAVVPADFNTIYHVNPLLSGANGYGFRIGGLGSTIAVVEQTDIQTADFNTFRTYFGLSGAAGHYSVQHPGGCTDPGFTGDEVEAAIDAEWASAPAPDANIIEASCAGTETSFGVMTTLQNLVEIPTNAQILSISYGGCEAFNGLTFLTMWNNLVEEGASEGLSIFVSSGDSGASCDRASYASNGAGVNGLASNAYDTAVGGTDFLDTYLGENATYWTPTNSVHGHGSALSYIPEVPWDNSCANGLLANEAHAANTTAFCNQTNSTVQTQNGVGGGGGQSTYIAKPDWQSLMLPGMPNDGARDLPDVSMFAANGIFAHFYFICMSDPNEGGGPCNYTDYNYAFGQAYGGTSVAAPAFAGIMGLVTQVYGRRIGNVAPRLYQIAQLQFTNTVLAPKCNASLGNKIGSACVFNNVTVGTNDEPCYQGTTDCAGTQPIDVLNTTLGSTSVDTWPAHKGYNLATGLGSVNAANLVYSY